METDRDGLVRRQVRRLDLANGPGEYPGISANFSGDGFADMRFTVKAVPPSDFAAWVKQVSGAGPALDDAGYAALAKPSEAVPPTTYSAVKPKLFERILNDTATRIDNAAASAAWCLPAL